MQPLHVPRVPCVLIPLQVTHESAALGAAEDAAHGTKPPVGTQVTGCPLDEVMAQLRVRVLDEDHVFRTRARQQPLQRKIQGAGFFVQVSDSADDLRAKRQGDFLGGIGAVVGNHHHPVRRLGLGFEGFERVRNTCSFIMRRDKNCNHRTSAPAVPGTEFTLSHTGSAAPHRN
ncbi:hypothetical protein D9M72_356620 [compost metagenome]